MIFRALPVAAVLVLSGCADAASPPASAGRETPDLTVRPSPQASLPATTPHPAPRPAGTVTLTDKDCTFVPSSDPLEAGLISLAFVNQTDDVGAFHLWRLDEDSSFEDFAAFISNHREQMEQGVDTGPPPFATMVGREVRTETRDSLSFNARDAIYGVACITPNEIAGRLVATYSAGPIPLGTPQAMAPSARVYHVMVGLGQGVALFGGETASPPAGGKFLFDTWEYSSGSGWVGTVAKGTPWADAAAFDRQSERVVVLLDRGGTSLYDPASDAWQERESTGGPGSTFGMRAAYDAKSDRTVLVAENGTAWAYDADTDAWAESAADGPPSRLWHAMAYDEGSDRIVIFGGTTRLDADLGDTWAYDLNTDSWEQMAPTTSPSARRYAAMAYDPETDRAILFGGVTGHQEKPLDDTWAYDYDTNTWTELSPATAPSARAWHGMARDADTGMIVLFGGGQTRDDATAETWLFNPSAIDWRTLQ